MNIAYYYHNLPRPAELLFSSVICGNSVTDTGKYMPGWFESNIDAFIVVGVDDEAVRQLYADATGLIVKVEEALGKQDSGSADKAYCDYKFKRLYRFDNSGSAARYINWLTSAADESDYKDFSDYEDVMRDLIDVWFSYEEPKAFARELTMKDWEPGGVFYEELHRPTDINQPVEPLDYI